MIEVIKYLLCTAGGVAIGYYFAHGRLEQEFQKRLERETDEARDFYRRKYMKKAKEQGEDPALTEAAINTAEALRQSYEGVSVGPDILTQEMSATVQRAVERGDLTVSDEELGELKKDIEADVTETLAEEASPEPEETKVPEDTHIRVRGLTEGAPARPQAVNYNRISTPAKSEEKPAPKSEKAEAPASAPADQVNAEVISKQAFVDNQFDYEQFSLTYFAGDDVLANEEDEPMEGNRAHMFGRSVAEKIKVGREAMEGSDTIFVRNHTGKWEFEITRSEGTFAQEVLGEAHEAE